LDEGYAFFAGIDRLVYPLNDDGWIHLSGLSGEELRLFSGLPARLHKGEAACIAIAKCRGWQFLSDDLEARKYARQLDVRVSGTVGCLVLAIERDRCSLDEANEWLHAMLQRGFRSPVLDLTPLLSKR
jgi:predicted nucleic acid-binding protein